MNTELFKQDFAEGYSIPYVEVIHIKTETVLCGSNNAQIPEYGDEDVWADE